MIHDHVTVTCVTVMCDITLISNPKSKIKKINRNKNKKRNKNK